MPTPNILSNLLLGYEQGQQNRERSRLQQLDQSYRDRQLGMQERQLGMQEQQFSDQQKAKRLDEIASGAFAADTPQKWEAFKQTWKAQGHTLDPSEEPFSAREVIINQAMGWKEKLAQSNADRSYQLQKTGQDNEQSYRNASLDIERQKLAASNPFLGMPGTAGTPGQAQTVPQVTGEDYLKTLPPQLATQVKALSEGRMQFPGGFALKSPYWQQMIQAVSQYDPTFDQVNYNSRMSTRRDFTSGKSAQNITSFNTAIQHLDTLDSSIDALHNTKYPTFNAAANYAANQSGDTRFQQAYKKFITARQAVASELTRAFRGSGGNVADIIEWNKSIDAADSPEALHAAVRTGIDLLRGRIESVGDTYNRGMGTTKDPIELLSPKARKAIEKIEGLAPAQVPDITGDQTGAPSQGNVIRYDENGNRIQ